LLLLKAGGLLYNGDGDLSGAQTERRGGAGPVGGLLGGKDPTGRFFSKFAAHVGRFCKPSRLAGRFQKPSYSEKVGRFCKPPCLAGRFAKPSYSE
jgi:hypothetical protein